MICVICHNQTRQVFITSGNPVADAKNYPKEIGLGRAGLGFLDFFIAYPITSSLAITMFHDHMLFGAGFKKVRKSKSVYFL